jgi:hypothetical protein
VLVGSNGCHQGLRDRLRPLLRGVIRKGSGVSGAVREIPDLFATRGSGRPRAGTGAVRSRDGLGGRSRDSFRASRRDDQAWWWADHVSGLGAAERFGLGRGQLGGTRGGEGTRRGRGQRPSAREKDAIRKALHWPGLGPGASPDGT